jgi:hypothetical protein
MEVKLDNANGLYESWEFLAKDEVDHIWGYDKETRKIIGGDPDLSCWLAQPINQASFQGYVQRCIEDQGGSWEIKATFTGRNQTYSAKVILGGAFASDLAVKIEDEKLAGIALLHSYLAVLALKYIRKTNPI